MSYLSPKKMIINIVLFWNFNEILDWVGLEYSSDIMSFLNTNFRNYYVYHMLIISRILKVIIIWSWFLLGIYNVACRIWIFDGGFRLGNFNETCILWIFNGGYGFWICSGGCSYEINSTIKMNSRNDIV